jgi:hypothetical protein
MVARGIGPGPIDGGPEIDLRVVCFGGVEVVPEPNRRDPDPAKDGNEGVKAPNIAVAYLRTGPRRGTNPETRDIWSRGSMACTYTFLWTTFTPYLIHLLPR